MTTVIRLRLIVAGIFFAFAGAASAAPITIDFDSYTAISSIQVDAMGYEFRADNASSGSMGVDDSFFGSGPDNALGYIYSSITFARADGGLFNLESLEVYHWFTGIDSFGFSKSQPYTITGYRADDTQVQISSNGLADNSWNTLSPAWTGLEAISVSASWDPAEFGYPFVGAIDNVVVTNVVPLPPALFLFGSALAWIATRRRPRQVR